MSQVGREELGAKCRQQLTVYAAAVAETDLELRGMHVHVDVFGRHVEAQTGDGVTARED